MPTNALKQMDAETKKELITAHYMKGQCLIEMFKYQESYASFDKVITMSTNNAFVSSLFFFF
jgi:hypothetical protein